MKIVWLRERADNYMIISGIKVSLDQVKVDLKGALGIPYPDCHIDKSRQGGIEILKISLVVDNNLFSDEIKNLERLIYHTEEMLSERVGVPIKIRLMQKRL